MDACKITIIKKGIKFQCNFFVVMGNWPALLGMPDCERLQLLGINCNTTNAGQNGKQKNERIKQDKYKTNKN